MILKPFKVHSPDGKTFYEGDACPAPSPSGEDAANVAIGEREACDAAYAKQAANRRTDENDFGAGWEYAIEWMQARAALTAEKVAAEPGSPEFDGAEAYQAHLEAQSAEQDEPVDFVFPPMPPAIVMHDKVGPLFDRLSMQFYASKCMSISALQPAQTQVALTDGQAMFALLERHERFHLGDDFRLVRVPVGQSLDFDEGSATRSWLHPYLGGEFHLVQFIAAQPAIGGKS